MQALVVLLQTGYTVFKRSSQYKKECFMWRPYMSFCLWPGISNTTICWIFIKFDIIVAYTSLYSKCEFHENWLSGTHVISYHVISYHIISYHVISFIYFLLIRTGLQNPYGYGNSHIFGNQEVKPTQRCTTIMWSSTMFEVSTQYKLFNITKYNKIETCIRTFECTY